MPKYVLEFKKKGLIKYTSHLDMLRLFKRAFKTSDIPLEYSQGYNPHPKMGFAQPLSLGYTSDDELLEFFCKEYLREEIILGRLRENMPDGIILKDLYEIEQSKNLTSSVVAAKYRAVLPLSAESRWQDISGKIDDYIAQSEIMALKREKKTKKYVEKNIKGQIRSIEMENVDGRIALLIELDAGSHSNLNPDLVIESFGKFAELHMEKGDAEVERLKLFFKENINRKL